jgi:hypothetical protein
VSRSQRLHLNHRSALECHDETCVLRLGRLDVRWTVFARLQIRDFKKLGRAGRLEVMSLHDSISGHSGGEEG